MKLSENLKEKVKRRSGEIIVAAVVLVLLIGLLSMTAPFWNQSEETDEPISITETEPAQTDTQNVELVTEPTDKPSPEPICTDKTCEIPEDKPIEQLPDKIPEPEPIKPVIEKQPNDEKNPEPEKKPSVPVAQHSHAYAVESVIAPTCTEQGYSIYLCECGDTYNSDYTDALGHAWSEWVITKQPSEDEEGIETRTCARCGIEENRSIEKLSHSHSHAVESIVEPTCTEQGYTVYICKCGDTYKADYTDALGHDWGEWVIVKKPTTYSEGLEQRLCQRCGEEEERSIDKLPSGGGGGGHSHSYSVDTVIAPTCTEKGYSVYLCRCGRTYNADYKDALDHDWDEWTIVEPATEDAEGTEKRVCKRNDAEEERSIPKLPHSHSHAVESIVDPTCTEQGYTIYRCPCGDTYNADYKDALDHDWGEWEVIKQPTTTEEGTEKRVCSRGDAEEEQSIDKLPDEPSSVVVTYHWKAQTWNGCDDVDGRFIWHNGGNTYYSHGEDQYVLNGNTWEPVTWKGYSDIDGKWVWTDGSKMYYSNGTVNYVLNGDTWEDMTWNGFNKINGFWIWSDGTHTYYSKSNNQYVLNGTTWEEKTWNGYSKINGNNIWSDGNNIYYSYTSTAQYKLNGDTWEAVAWNGNTNVYGERVWTNGKATYYSEGTTKGQYILNGDTWETVTWVDSSFTYPDGAYVWTDGTNTYYSGQYSGDQYVLYKKETVVQ